MQPPQPAAAVSRRPALVALGAMIAAMWLSEGLDAALPLAMDQWGIRPRDAEHLAGIGLAPWLHGGWGHLAANTPPFAAMGLLIALGGLARLLSVTAVVALVSGAGTWLFGGSGTVHIGASGVVFGFATYLLARGLFDRRPLHLLLGVGVGVVYGGMVAQGLLPQQGISWQGHAFGALGGLVAAYGLGRRDRRARRSKAEQDALV